MHSRVVVSERTWLWSIVMMGGILRFYRLDFQSLWYDEGLQYFIVSNNSFGELLNQTRSFHPPLSFLINDAFFLMGQSEFYLRLPSAIFGIASLPVFYILARELTSARAALFSTFVLAISPFHVWYSQDGRMYSQVLFFSLASSVLLLKAIKTGKAQWWVYYVLVSAAGVYTHVFMLLALAAQLFWVIIYHRNRLIAHAASGAMVFILFLPWIIFLPWVQRFFQGVAEHGLGSGAPVGSTAAFRAGLSWESVPYTFFTYSSGFSLGPTVAELHENRSLGFILQFAPEILSVGTVFGVLLLFGLLALYSLFGARSIVFCVLGLSIPIVGTLLYALAPRSHYNVRYTIVALPYFCILIGAGMTYAVQRYKAVGMILSLGILTASSASLANHFFNPRYAKEDIRSAITFWRSDGNATPLLSYRSNQVLSAYLTESEKGRHSPVGGDVTSDVSQAFFKTGAPSVYLLLARDWQKLKEKAVRDAFSIDEEESYPGVKILKIFNPHTARNHVRPPAKPQLKEKRTLHQEGREEGEALIVK